jgi:hypothetical protein
LASLQMRPISGRVYRGIKTNPLLEIGETSRVSSYRRRRVFDLRCP